MDQVSEGHLSPHHCDTGAKIKKSQRQGSDLSELHKEPFSKSKIRGKNSASIVVHMHMTALYGFITSAGAVSAVFKLKATKLTCL